jgi:hypothetical protein
MSLCGKGGAQGGARDYPYSTSVRFALPSQNTHLVQSRTLPRALLIAGRAMRGKRVGCRINCLYTSSTHRSIHEAKTPVQSSSNRTHQEIKNHGWGITGAPFDIILYPNAMQCNPSPL